MTKLSTGEIYVKRNKITIGGNTINIGQVLAKGPKETLLSLYPIADRLYKEVDDVPELPLKSWPTYSGFIGI